MARGIITAGGGHGWETGLVAALGGPGASLTVVRRCADMADVLAVASTGQVSGAVIAAGMRGLTGDSVLELSRYGVPVVVVRPASDDRAAVLAERMGAAGSIPDDLPPEDMIAEIERTLAAGDDREVDGVSGVSDPGLALPVPRHAADEEPWVPEADAVGRSVSPPRDDGPATRRRARADARRRRRVRHRRSDEPTVGAPRARGTAVAIWGPRGAPGRSTVAMGLADRIAATDRTVLIIDADVYGGIIASALGLLDESAGLAGACRLAATGRLDAAALTELCWSLDGPLTVLTGISRADRWPEVRPSAIPVILDIARDLAEVVIVDCAPLVEADEEVTFDTMAPRRNGATIAAIAAADLLVAVGSADPPGVERLVRGLEELGEAVPGATPQVVFNRVRGSAASPAELTAALRRFSGMSPAAFLPEDRAACDAAWGDGRLLTAAAAKSALTRSFDALARSLLG